MFYGLGSGCMRDISTLSGRGCRSIDLLCRSAAGRCNLLFYMPATANHSAAELQPILYYQEKAAMDLLGFPVFVMQALKVEYRVKYRS